jgi:hypothetical protein
MKSLGQIAYEARWAMDPTDHRWHRLSTINQLRYEEAASAVVEEYERLRREARAFEDRVMGAP